jgi:hypothetical protein
MPATTLELEGARGQRQEYHASHEISSYTNVAGSPERCFIQKESASVRSTKLHGYYVFVWTYHS